MFEQGVPLIPLLICFWLAAYSEQTKDSCICGYGGLCRFIDGHPMDWNCSYEACEAISGGLYTNCSELVNHCHSSPCMNHGKCVMSFGSFFCVCPPEFFGHTCNYRRNEETLNMATVVAPRVWFQANRAPLTMNQPMYMTFEDPGEEVQLQVRFKDGRFYEVSETKFKILNAREQCIRDVRANPEERDIRVCETLPYKNDVYSVKIDTRFFNDGTQEVEVKLPSLGVAEGRVDPVHIAILNRGRVSFSQEYQIHTSFDLSERCKFNVSFIGCSRTRHLTVLHNKYGSTFLRALLTPSLKNCSSGLIVGIKWNMPIYGEHQSFVKRRGALGISIEGKFLNDGVHFIDFVHIMKGIPPYYGSSDVVYSFGRCWFKQVSGPFNVGILNGANRTTPCTSPLAFRLVSYNSNFPLNELASKWNCRSKEVQERGACRRQRFLGSKIVFGTLSCYASIVFDVVVLHIRTGFKLHIAVEVNSNEHVDTLQCHCLQNCHPNVNPLSKTLLRADDFRLSTDNRITPITWYAWMHRSRDVWEIGRFVVPGSSARFVEIDRRALVIPNLESIGDIVLVVRAQEGHRFCEIDLKIQTPSMPLQTMLFPSNYRQDVRDYRSSILILNANTNLMNQQHTFEAREKISLRKPDAFITETVETIRAGYNELRNLRMSYPTYVVGRNPMGLESDLSQIHEPTNHNSTFSIREIEDMINATEIIFAEGNVELVLSELVYISRFLMVLPKPPLRLRTQLLRILNEMEFDTFHKGLSQYDMFLTILARLTFTLDVTEPPFNLDPYPWVAPPDDIGPDEVLQMDEFRKLAILTILNLCKDYVGVISKKQNPSYVIRFVFHALLNYSLLRLREPEWEKLLASNHLIKMQNAQLYEMFNDCVDYLLIAGDYHSEGYSDREAHDVGTSTFFYTIFPRIDVSKITSEIFNQIQHVAIRITIEEDIVHLPDFVTLYLGVYVEIPSPTEMTTRVHIAFFTHLTHEPVKAKIEVQMKVQKPLDEDFTIVENVRNLLGRSPEKSVILYKIQFSPDSDIVTDRDERNIILHFASQADIRFYIHSDVPTYETALLSPDHGSGNFNVSLISDRNTFYLALVPGEDVSANSSYQVRIDASEFVCVRRSSALLSNGYEETKEICEIGGTNQTNMTGNLEVVCVCSGPGIIYTYKLAALVFKVLTEEDVEHELKGLDDAEFSLLIFCLILPFVLTIFAIACRRDKRNTKREFIQILSDSFPGDTHPYIVGVFTGHQLFAGTVSRVALQIHGNESSSRVHILWTRSFQALGFGQDDWFLIYTKERLGKILKISLWKDFAGPCHNWYCSHLVVYDITGVLWYAFPVHRWFRLAEGIQFCRTEFFHAVKFHPENDSRLSFTFCKHYKTVLRNVNSLFSVFSKHRRHIFSYRQKALLAAMFLLSLLCSAIVFEGLWVQLNLEMDAHILSSAFIALLPVFILLAALTSVFMRSYANTRKTKKLDLRKAGELKSMMTEKKDDGHVTFKSVNVDGKPLIDVRVAGPSAGAYKKSHEIPARAHDSPIAHGYGEKHHLAESRNSTVAHGHGEKHHLDESRNSTEWWRQGSLWVQKTTAQCWIPDASFRPIRFDHEQSYIRYGGRSYLFVGWILATLVIIVSLVYLSYRTFASPYPGRKVFLITIFAILLEMLVVEPLILLVTSCYSVFKTKQGNVECNILELGGLPENKNKIDHEQFLDALTQPYYRPPRTKRLERLYQHHEGCYVLKIFCFFHLVIIFVLIPFVWLAVEQDTYSIWVLGNRTREAIHDHIKFENMWSQTTEDYVNKGMLLLWNGYMRLTSLVNWYNGRPMALGKASNTWFVTRSSKLYGTSVFRYLKATNSTKNFVDAHFKPYYSAAYGSFDPYVSNTAFLSEWHPVAPSESTPRKDFVMYNGIYGKTGLFYPQTSGMQVFVRGEKKLKSLGIQKAVFDNFDEQIRALIVDVNLIQPVFSPRVLAPAYGLSLIHILFENLEGGPYTTTIRSAVVPAPSTKNFFGYISIVYYSALTVTTWSFIVIRTWQEGLTVFRHFRQCVLTVIAILSFALDVLFLKNYVIGHVNDSIARSIDVNTHVDFVHYIATSSNLERVLNGPLYLCMCIILTDLIYTISGLKGRHDARLIWIGPIAFLLYLFASVCFEGAMEVLDVFPIPRMSVIRTVSYSGDSDGAIAIIYLFKFIWLAAVGIFIASLSAGLERNTTGYPFFQILAAVHYLPSSFDYRKSHDTSSIDSLSRRSVKYELISERKSSLRSSRKSSPSSRRPSKRPQSEEMQARDGGSQPMYTSVANRLSRIFMLIE